jgi:peptidoglycan/LPS O-acetylase OafA/YrhL
MAQRPMPGFIRAGYLGVPFFFVLSGFILANVYCSGSGPINKRAFAVARFARIYPAFLAGLLLMLIGPYSHILQGYVQSGHGLRAIFEPIATLLMLHSWTFGSYMSWNGPAWTLGCEAFFYLLFPFIAPAIARLSAKGAFSVMVGAFLVSSLRFLDADAMGWFATRTPIGRLPEFVFGIALWVLWRERGGVSQRSGLAIAMVGAVVACIAFAFHDEVPRGVLDACTLAPVFGLLIYGLACVHVDVTTRAFKVADFLGEASYAMYIMQLGAMGLAVKFITRVTDNACVLFAGALAAGVLAGCLTQVVIEVPCRRWLRAKLS